MASWSFGDFVLDLETRELRRAGAPVPLSPKAFQLLGILVASAPKALSKIDLQDRLWPGTFVVEKNLTNLVGEIREALGDDAAQPAFIRTVHRFGYAFCAQTVDARVTRHNLPVQLTKFIGRAREITELLRLSQSSRLLTLTGPGGCGKTRLALEAAAHLLDHFRDGVWFVDLATLTDPSLVTQTIASVLDVRAAPNRTLSETLADHLHARQTLLILDNCEHLIAACAAVAEELVCGASRLFVLATSREALGIPGESIARVLPLSLPDISEPASPEMLSQFDAVALFVERARATDAAFTVTAQNASLIADLCHRLDGIPLAIELAAARLNVLSLDQIHARLNNRFRLLTGGSRTAVPRHSTLEATVDWSYDLLSEAERRLLCRLSVFAGGWTLEAAEDVCAYDGVRREDVLDLLTRLVEQSLVTVETDRGGARHHRFLETVHQYARERVESDEAERLRHRHLACFLELARRAEPELTRADQISWLERLQREHGNMRSALEWCLAAPERRRQGLELAGAISWFWMKRGYFREGQQWLERALSSAGHEPPALRAKALMGLGNMIFFQGDFGRAQVVLAESATLARAEGDLFVLSFSLGMSAIAALEMGDIATCGRLATEGQAAARASATPWVQGPSLSSLAYQALHEGDLDRAGRLHEESLELLRTHGEKWGVGISLLDLSLLRVIQQRHADARALCADGLTLYQEFGDRRGVAWCLGILSGAEAAEGRTLHAARLRGAMEGLLESVGAPVQATYNIWVGEKSITAMKQSLGDSVFESALAEGRAMPLSRAVQLGLQPLSE